MGWSKDERVPPVFRNQILTCIKQLWSVPLSWVTLRLKCFRVNTWNNGVSERRGQQGIYPTTGWLFHFRILQQLQYLNELCLISITINYPWKLYGSWPQERESCMMPVWLSFEITTGFPWIIITCPSPGTTFAQRLLSLVILYLSSCNHQANRLALHHRKPQSC